VGLSKRGGRGVKFPVQSQAEHEQLVLQEFILHWSWMKQIVIAIVELSATIDLFLFCFATGPNFGVDQLVVSAKIYHVHPVKQYTFLHSFEILSQSWLSPKTRSSA
jgi:hypothetical protein